VSEGVLSSGEAERLACATGVFRLADENPELAAALIQAPSPSSPGVPVRSVRELARWSRAHWEKFIAGIPGACPPGVSAADRAAALAMRVEVLFPTDALMSRIESPDIASIRGRLEELNSVISAYPGILVENGAASDARIGAMPEADRERLGRMRQTLRAFPGMELEALAQDTGVPPAERAAAIAGRMAAVREVFEKNPEVELLRLDFGVNSSPADRLDFGNVAEADRPRVINALKAYQRVYRLAESVDRMQSLVQAGYHSAAEIARDGISLVSQNTGIPDTDAERIYRAARKVSASSNVWLGAAMETLDGGFDQLPSSNTAPHVSQYLKNIGGYADLFGRQDYCRCDHCCSVLSPAAYFVDLMHLVQTRITQPNFSGNYAEHALNLRVRRPDLWALPLTCANTDTLIPQLRIVDEVLAAFIARKTGAHVRPDNLDATLSGIAPRLAAARDSFRQPSCLPLRTVETLLTELGVRRADIARLLGKDADAVAAGVLGFAPEEIPLVATANAAPAFLEKIYGRQFPKKSGAELAEVDAQALLQPMGLNRAQLGELLQTRFVL
ncbi:MAG TPA: Tc toxin subunit A, partial [Thermodesulfobacteriota bacterium]|nr:Tc toxin subunit A [Thermodesulfobacteriota bacterium]